MVAFLTEVDFSNFLKRFFGFPEIQNAREIVKPSYSKQTVVLVRDITQFIFTFMGLFIDFPLEDWGGV